jgi:hypothetical protein
VDRQEALHLLGLDDSASREAIEAAWRAQMKLVHPDSGRAPDTALAGQVNEARDVAVAGLTGMEVVPVDTVAALVRAVAREQVPVRGSAASDKAVRQVVMRHVGRLAQRRRQQTALALLAAGIAALTALVRTTFDLGVVTTSQEAVLATVLVGFTVVAAVVGLLAWNVASREKMLRLEIEDAAETLADKAAFVETIAELELGETWARDELRQAIVKWSEQPRPPVSPIGSTAVPLSVTADRIGAVDFARLLVVRGLEHGLVSEELIPGPTGGRRYGYRLQT